MLDNMCLKMNIVYRKIKFRKMDKQAFGDNMRSWKGVSKHHPNSFQEGVLAKFKQNLTRLEAITGLNLQ